MPHPRTAIRHAIRDLLIAANTAAAERVFATQKSGLRQSDLPALCVYMLEESVDGDSANKAPRELMREAPVTIECWVAGGEDVDDQMDALALQVEKAMHVDPGLSGTASDSLLDTTVLFPDATPDRSMGMAALTYQVTYRTLAVTPAENLDDFLVAGATYNPGNVVHEDDDAHDVFEVQTP